MRKTSYDPTKNEIVVANIGRKLMEIAAGTFMKGMDDEGIARINRMSSFGDTLTRFGAPFGPKNLEEALKVSRCTKEEASEFMHLGHVNV